MPARIVSLIVAVLLCLLAAPAPAQEPLAAPIAAVRDAMRSRAFDLAVERGEAAVEALPDSAVAWLWLGQACAAQAQTASFFARPRWATRSKDAFEKAVLLDPRNPEALFALMQYMAMAPGIVGGDDERARELAAQMAALDPIWGHLATGSLALAIDEDKTAAESAYRTALDADPDSLRARQSLGALYSNEKRWSDARAVWDAQLQRKPDDGFAIYAIGRLAALSGEDLERGLAMLDRYIALADKPADIGEAPAHWRRGLVLDHLDRREEAIESIRKALALDANMADARKDLERLED